MPGQAPHSQITGGFSLGVEERSCKPQLWFWGLWALPPAWSKGRGAVNTFIYLRDPENGCPWEEVHQCLSQAMGVRGGDDRHLILGRVWPHPCEIRPLLKDFRIWNKMQTDQSCLLSTMSLASFLSLSLSPFSGQPPLKWNSIRTGGFGGEEE